MKKVLSIVLAIAMIAAMSAVAFAADNPPKILNGAGKAEIAVNGTFVNDENAKEDNYKVVISWEAFSYTFTNGKYWDVDSLTWKQNEVEGVTAGTWTGNATQDIKVKNYSSLPITVKADYEGLNDFTFGAADASGEGVVVPAADTGAEVGTMQEVDVTATFVNEKDVIEETGVIGTITVTIA